MKILLAVLVVAGLPALVHAQAPVPLTNAQLRAKVTALQLEISGLQRDYAVILASCQTPASPPPRPAAATPVANVADEAMARAIAAREQVVATLTSAQEERDEQTRIDNRLFYVKSVGSEVTERNKSWARHAWKVTIRNGLARPQAFDLTVQFLNKAGFVIDTARLYNQGVDASDERTLLGDVLITMPGGVSVTDIKASFVRKAPR